MIFYHNLKGLSKTLISLFDGLVTTFNAEVIYMASVFFYGGEYEKTMSYSYDSACLPV